MAKSNPYSTRVVVEGVSYDSMFEYRLLHQTSLTKSNYHGSLVNYEMHSDHTYYPDFYEIGSNGKFYYFEAKGRFICRQDLVKYQHIVKRLNDGKNELIFIFENPNTKIPGAKRRKDGTFLTNSSWADKVQIRWITEKDVNDFLRKIRNECDC